MCKRNGTKRRIIITIILTKCVSKSHKNIGWFYTRPIEFFANYVLGERLLYSERVYKVYILTVHEHLSPTLFLSFHKCLYGEHGWIVCTVIY